MQVASIFYASGFMKTLAMIVIEMLQKKKKVAVKTTSFVIQ